MQKFVDDNSTKIDYPIVPLSPSLPFQIVLRFKTEVPLSDVDLTNFTFASDRRLSVYVPAKSSRVDVGKADVGLYGSFKEVKVIFDEATVKDGMLVKLKLPPRP